MGIKIGADPEFVLVNKEGSTVGASGMPFAAHGNFGKDGASNTCELRPLPATSADEAVDNLRECMAVGYHSLKEVRKWDWECHSSAVACGAHIHFSGMQMTTDILEALMLTVGVPVRAATHPDGWKARLPTYGRWAETRQQPHGTEWRSLGGCYGKPAYWEAIMQACFDIVGTEPAALRQKLVLFEPLRKKFEEIHAGGIEGAWNCEGCLSLSMWGAWQEMLSIIVGSPLGELAWPVAEALGRQTEPVTFIQTLPLQELWELKGITLETTEREVVMKETEYFDADFYNNPDRAPWKITKKVKTFNARHKVILQ